MTTQTYTSLTPLQLQKYYTPNNTVTHNLGVNNPTIVVINAYASNTVGSDVNAFSDFYTLPHMNIPDGFGNLQVTDPSLGNLYLYYQYGSSNFSTSPNAISYPLVTTASTATDVNVNIQSIHAMAPYANIAFLQISTISSINFANALNFAQNILPNTLNVVGVVISWGTKENISDKATFSNAFTNPNMMFFGPIGNNKSVGILPNMPAAYMVACGGTSIATNPDGTLAEQAWNGSTGGICSMVQKPLYQTSLSYAMRAVPDIAMDADPLTCFKIITNGVVGANVGGTSTAAMLAAGVMAVLIQQYMINHTTPATQIVRINQSDFLTYLYVPNGEIDISINSKSNKWTNYQQAATGYDLATGNGSLNFANMLEKLTFTTISL